MSGGDMWDFEKFNFKNIARTIRDNPEQLFLGAMEPVGGKLWGEILHKDYDEPLNAWGGPNSSTYDKAEAEGIDASSSNKSHDIARGIAGIFAGNYAAGAAGFGGAGGAAGGAGGGAAGGGAAGGGAAGGGGGAALGGGTAEGGTAAFGEGVGSAEASGGGAAAGGGWQEMAKKFMNQGAGQMGQQQQAANDRTSDRRDRLQQQILADLLRQEQASQRENAAWQANQRGASGWTA